MLPNCTLLLKCSSFCLPDYYFFLIAGMVHPETHYLFTLMSFQTCMLLFDSVKYKKEIDTALFSTVTVPSKRICQAPTNIYK